MQQIQTVCANQAPSETKMNILWTVKERIEKRLRAANFLADQQWELIIYGSTLSSVCSNDHSDLDMTLILHEPHNHT